MTPARPTTERPVGELEMLVAAALADLRDAGTLADALEERGDPRGVLLRRRWKRWQKEWADTDAGLRLYEGSYAGRWAMLDILGLGSAHMAQFYRVAKQVGLGHIPVRGHMVRRRHIRAAHQELVSRRFKAYIRKRFIEPMEKAEAYRQHREHVRRVLDALS